MVEENEKDDINLAIEKVINDPLHGREFYTSEMINDLRTFLQTFCSVIDEKMTDMQKIKTVNEYMKKSAKLDNEYFDIMKFGVPIQQKHLYHRTAHAALIEKKAICVGITEATRLLLESTGVKTYSCLAMLPDSVKTKESGKEVYKEFFHYLTLAECNDNGEQKIVVLDPERQANRERKGKDFKSYMETVRLVDNPPKEFVDNKIGKTGLGTRTNDIPNLALKEISDIGDILDSATVINKENKGDEYFDQR